MSNNRTTNHYLLRNRTVVFPDEAEFYEPDAEEDEITEETIDAVLKISEELVPITQFSRYTEDQLKKMLKQLVHGSVKGLKKVDREKLIEKVSKDKGLVGDIFKKLTDYKGRVLDAFNTE